MAASKLKPISPFRLSTLLRLQKDPARAFQLFQDQSSTKPFRYSLLSYDIIINKLGRAKMFDEMEQIIRQLRQQDTRFLVPEQIFCHVISFYGKARLLAPALRTFHSIPSFHCKPTIKSFNSLLDALLNCRELGKMRELFMEVTKYGNPDVCTYNILIHACCLYYGLDDAWHVFDEMRRRGICPNVVTFGTLIHGLCLNSMVKEAFRLKDEMARDFKLKPNSSMYTTLLKGLCRIGDLSFALSLKEEMESNRVPLDAAVYNTLINALFLVGRKEEAFGLLEEMKETSCKPNTVTYNALITGVCREKNFEEAYRILDEMGDKGCMPNVMTFNIIISGLCKEGKWNEANDIYQDMRRYRCVPDVISCRILFDGLCDCMRFKEVAFLLEEMMFKGYLPHSVSIFRFIEGLFQEGNIDLLMEVLISLGKQNVLHVNIWELLVSMVSEKEKPLPAIELLDCLIIPL